MNGREKRCILDAIDSPEDLTVWEWDFVNSLADRGEDYELSERQEAVIARIAEKLYGD